MYPLFSIRHAYRVWLSVWFLERELDPNSNYLRLDPLEEKSIFCLLGRPVFGQAKLRPLPDDTLFDCISVTDTVSVILELNKFLGV